MEKNLKRNCNSEKVLEALLVKAVTARGGIALKLTSQFHRGMPDRLVLLPGKTVVFVEMKSTGKKPSALQVAAMKTLVKLGFSTLVIDNMTALNRFIEDLDNGIYTA